MKITLEKIKSEKKVSGCYDDADIISNAGYKADKPVRICYEALLKKDGVKLDLQISGEIKLQCDRCLSDFVHKIAVINSSNISFADFKEEFEVDEEARQLTVLAIPMKMLCNDYCKGLCPVCGISLNNEKCCCSFKPVDTRFEKLKNLKF